MTRKLGPVIFVSLLVASVLATTGAQATSTLETGMVLEDGGVAVVVPPPGYRVYIEHWLRRGGTRQLQVTHKQDGRIEVRRFEQQDGTEMEDASSGTSTTGLGCGDHAYSLHGHSWAGGSSWFFRADTTPEYLDPSNVAAVLQEAASNLTDEKSPCTATDQVDLVYAYADHTSAPADIDADGRACASLSESNRMSVVEFGELPWGVLGAACTWSTLWNVSRPTVVESDIRLNRTDLKWFTKLTSSCSGRYSLEGVMTHELGHSVGLGHVGEAEHPNLTMSTAINGTCQNGESSLGSGDVRALRALY